MSTEPMTPSLREAVTSYLYLSPTLPVFTSPVSREPEPVFQRLPDGSVGHVSGHPMLLEIAVDVLNDPVGMTWDGECLVLPGGLRYRPVGVTRVPTWVTVVCERADLAGKNPAFNEATRIDEA